MTLLFCTPYKLDSKKKNLDCFFISFSTLENTNHLYTINLVVKEILHFDLNTAPALTSSFFKFFFF